MVGELWEKGAESLAVVVMGSFSLRGKDNVRAESLARDSLFAYTTKLSYRQGMLLIWRAFIQCGRCVVSLKASVLSRHQIHRLSS
jgi:hypothetical protein